MRPRAAGWPLIGTAARTTFDSFNGFILKGDPAQGLEYLFDTLMTRALDEPDAVYGLVAQSAELAPDRSSVTFRMRPEAKFADGSALTAADVVFTFDILKEKGHPIYPHAASGTSTKAEALDAHTVRYTFTGAQTRDLPLVVAGLPILSKAYYATREFDQTTLDPPLGSGPYRIGDFKQGAFVSYQRREDYWGKDLPVNRGRFNFDEMRYEYYRDRTADAGKLARPARSTCARSSRRATGSRPTIFPQSRTGRLQRLDAARRKPVRRARLLPQHAPAEVRRHARAQGARLRLRLRVDQQEHLLRALHAHRELLRELRHEGHGQAERRRSWRCSSRSAASCRRRCSSEPYKSPVSDGSGQDRKLLREAGRLLDEAGWKVKDGKRVNAKGEVLELEFLIVDPTAERILTPYVKNLQAIGVAGDHPPHRCGPIPAPRQVVRFRRGRRTRYALRLTPGRGARSYWGSEAAKTDGSLQSRRHQPPGRRRADRQGDGGQEPRRS